MPSAVEAQSPNHWTAREVPKPFLTTARLKHTLDHLSEEVTTRQPFQGAECHPGIPVAGHQLPGPLSWQEKQIHMLFLLQQ